MFSRIRIIQAVERYVDTQLFHVKHEGMITPHSQFEYITAWWFVMIGLALLLFLLMIRIQILSPDDGLSLPKTTNRGH